MSEDLGTQAQKPTSILKREIKVNLKSLLLALGKAAINGAFLKWDDLAESGLDVVEALGLKRTPGEIGGLLVTLALVRGMKKLIQENGEEEPENLKQLYQQLSESLEGSDIVINEGFFKQPKDLPFLQEAQTIFAQWLAIHINDQAMVEQINRRLPSYFVLALHEEWLARPQEYTILLEELDTPFTQANQRERGWLHYRASLQQRVEEPMFFEAFGLKQVYIHLRAYYEREKSTEEARRGILIRNLSEKKDHERVVVDLAEELRNWVKKADKKDAIRLLTGGPGSGKSSFGRIFAAQLAEESEVPVLFIPLHLLRVTKDLVQGVGEFIEKEKILHHNPLDSESSESRLLIIFDGLDELSMQGKVAAETARQFVDEVRFLVTSCNQQKTCLQVIISGREVVVQANRTKFRKDHQLLYLLPYFVTEEERKYTEDYIDPGNLLEKDQRRDWWCNYGRSKGKAYTGLPQELDRDNLVDITAQPLLNYLIALSYERDKLSFTSDTNLNEIYADLLKEVYERSYEGEDRKHHSIKEISQKEFIGILEEIALACWHGDGRTTTVEEIEQHCRDSGLKKVLERFQQTFRETSQASITRLLTAFYFRESGDFRENEKTFEFTHKSFGEYLTAKRIVEGLQLIHEDLEERKRSFRKGCNEEEALVTWAKLCSPSRMDKYLFKFIRDEIGLRKKEELCQWQLTLCRLIEYMLEHGMPMERFTSLRFQEKMQRSRNAEEALLALLNACACLTEQVSEISWPTHSAFGDWIARLQGQRIGAENVLALDCLSWLNLKACVLAFRDFCGVHFREANLEGANLEGANLVGANLVGANLVGANLERANLERANFVGANLVGANLERADLERANFEGARL